jgi:hypothetical protein
VISAIDFVLTLLTRLVAAVLTVIGVVEAFCRRLLVDAGVTGQLQAAILVIVAVLLILAALRLLGGVFGLLITVLLILLVIHVLMPGLQIPTQVHL